MVALLLSVVEKEDSSFFCILGNACLFMSRSCAVIITFACISLMLDDARHFLRSLSTAVYLPS